MEQTLSFLTALFEAYQTDPELRLEIRCLSPQWDTEREKPWPRQWYPLTSQGLQSACIACEHYAKRWEVYYSVLPRLGRSGRQDDVKQAAVLFCDVDGGEEGPEAAVQLVKKADIPNPHIAVISGGGLHCYWLLEEIITLPEHSDREGFKSTLRRLCAAIGGQTPQAHADTAACEVARILRLPGTYNRKRKEEPRPVRLVRSCSEMERFAYTQWKLDILPDEKVPVRDLRHRKEVSGYTETGFVSDGLLRWAERGYPEGQRHKGLISDAAWLVRQCRLSKADALSLLHKKAQHSPGRHAVTEQEIEDMIQWA